LAGKRFHEKSRKAQSVNHLPPPRLVLASAVPLLNVEASLAHGISVEERACTSRRA
jgi:hypothetical protein